ncbi:MAG: hypothetical protein M3O70_07575 [Actinomycetota bacterium]|nr:hypothetical protein [Actinomycetota bacterium]
MHLRRTPAVEPCDDSAHHPGFARPYQGDGQPLWNLAPLIPEAQRFSRFSRFLPGRGELIDHLLASHKLVTAIVGVTAGEIEVAVGH